VFEAIDGAEPVVKFKAVHIRKAVIKYKEVRRESRDRFDCIASVNMMNSAVGCLLVNNLDKEIPDIYIIFYYENQLIRRKIHMLQFLSSHASE